MFILKQTDGRNCVFLIFNLNNDHTNKDDQIFKLTISIFTHFLTNGKKGNKTLISIDGTISANNRTPVDGVSHTLFRMHVNVILLSPHSMDGLASC